MTDELNAFLRMCVFDDGYRSKAILHVVPYLGCIFGMFLGMSTLRYIHKNQGFLGN